VFGQGSQRGPSRGGARIWTRRSRLLRRLELARTHHQMPPYWSRLKFPRLMECRIARMSWTWFPIHEGAEPIESDREAG
jgi:hypothetical protein